MTKTNTAVYRVVTGAMSWAVTGAMSEAVNAVLARDTFWAVDRAVYWAPDRAAIRAGYGDPAHHALADFLSDADRRSLWGQIGPCTSTQTRTCTSA